MSLVDNNGLTAADVAAVVGGNNSFGWGDNGAWWLIILFLFFMSGNGWGNNGYTNNGGYIVNDVQRGFDQSSIMNGLSGISNQINNLAMSQQNGICENRASIADLKYTVATEACADRSAISEALRDVIASNTANTQVILDKLCQQEIDALKAQNANLQTQINIANMQSSQAEQTARILADNAAQTAALENYLNPAPIPAYVVQNPNCCGPVSYNGCCGYMS